MTYSMMRFAAYDWAKTVVHTGKSVCKREARPLLPKREEGSGEENKLITRYNNTYPRIQNGFSRINGWWNCRFPRESSRINNGQDAG
jgi:hypothetical protein